LSQEKYVIWENFVKWVTVINNHNGTLMKHLRFWRMVFYFTVSMMICKIKRYKYSWIFPNLIILNIFTPMKVIHSMPRKNPVNIRDLPLFVLLSTPYKF